MLPTVEATSVQVSGPRTLRLCADTLVLEGMSQREVACETLYTAISPGTEMAAFDGLTPLRPERSYSKVVGYCNLSRVVGTGEWVRRYRAGDLVLTLESHRSHFISGEDEILLKLPAAEYDDDALVAASTTYLFHQGYSALLRGDLKPGQYVAVVGLGTLGLATVAVASRFGARVLALSDQPGSRELAVEFGARLAQPKVLDDTAQAAIAETTAGTGVDIVVLTSSRWQDWQLALDLVRSGGRVCVLGFPGRREPVPPFNPLDPTRFYRKQLSLISCGYTPDVDIDPRDIRFTIRRNCAYLLELILKDELPARRLVSAVEPWYRIGDLYERIGDRETGFRTAVLQWHGVDAPADLQIHDSAITGDDHA